MPMGNQTIEQASATARVLAYGEAKRKKTWWAIQAAMAGFNVLLLDGDKGHEIINQIPEKNDAPWKHRVRIIQCADTFSKPVFCDLVTRFLNGATIRWNDTTNKIVPTGGKIEEAHAHFVLEASKLGENDILVLDSWTSFIHSLHLNYCIEADVNILTVQKDDQTWNGYEYSGRISNFVIGKTKGLKCHVVVIAHEQKDELTVPKRNDRTGKMERELTGEVRTTIASASKNHARSVAASFSDVLYFNMHGATNYVDARADQFRLGGSRNINAEKMLDQFHLGDMLKQLGHAPKKDAPMPGCVYYAPGELNKQMAPVPTKAEGVITPQAEGKKVGFTLGSPTPGK